MRPVPEQRILVTGATDGLGKGVATELAKAGATVLLHGRDDERGRSTLEHIKEATGNDKLRWYRADLASLSEVRHLAERVEADHEHLDALVNNAGIGTSVPGGGARGESADGFELRLAVNYLAGFLLTRLLLPLVERSAPARIVNVSSAGQMPIDFDDLMLERHYDGTRAYCQSKLAQIMLTIDLAEELAGSGVTVNCLHPATFMPTKMVLEAGGRVASSLEDGVEATTRLVLAPELAEVSGRYFNRTEEATANAQAYDPTARLRLRQLSEQLTGATSSPGR
ncbi:MAG: SDR family NAD(P)-dependent oxidoreductase [Acidimicrobiales bacterium]|nr:SDR family NAD(P)-dependent oxidoreductase [Acidimicrobiales bacterium]